MSGPAPDLVERVSGLIRDALQVDLADPDVDLVDEGYIDSLALVTLITELEVEFGFELPLDDFDLESFRSARQIAGVVAAGMDGGAG